MWIYEKNDIVFYGMCNMFKMLNYIIVSFWNKIIKLERYFSFWGGMFYVLFDNNDLLVNF